MKIAQLTLTGYYNYGNMLQKFALHHTLKKFTDSTELLCPTDSRFFPETGVKRYAQCVLNPERKNNPDYMDAFYRREAVRQNKFRDFENLYVETRFDFPYFEDIADEYDFFVVGSDQVWNPKWYPSYIFLEFVPRKKKIAYAARIGTPEIPDDKKEIFRRGISNFNHLSVREEDAVKIIKELTGRASIVVPDPVLLLSKEEWLTVSQRPTWFKEKYRNGFVLTYYLRKLPPPEVKTLADELGLPVINLLDVENYNHFTVGPAEFVWLFANASLIFTNSFHGVAFSILFKRPFINREIENDKSGVSMSNRMMTVLELFGLKDRRPSAEKFFTAKEALAIDFTRRDEVLPVERAKAFNFLAGALSGAPTKK
ncbi:MAG: polysaccharide pyruvyl transferase family protein [Selenomonadaceae bacterium]|nr:polysaccharide pyruvyl transferase family protein [Selenomonadaceae bacterium]